MFTITSISFTTEAQREVIINLRGGKQVKIYGADTYGTQPTAYVQHGFDGLTLEQKQAYGFTQPVAEHYAKWLNGGTMPKAMQQVPTSQPAASRIPCLRSWEGNSRQGYQCFTAGLGYLRIKPVSQGFALTHQPDLDGVNVGPALYIESADTAAELVEIARLEFNTPKK